jgi:hypothetical protein
VSRFSIIILAIATSMCVKVTPKEKRSDNFVQVPEKYARVMKQHIMMIEKEGFGEATPGDLYHGHLLLKYSKKYLHEPISLDELFAESVGILYHSDEMLVRWKGEDGELPFEKRRPRSIFGYWNGEVTPVISLFKNLEGTAHYLCCGTIHTDELAREHPKEFAFWRSYKVLTASSKLCPVNFIVDIYYSSRRPPSVTIHKKNYSLTMECSEGVQE